MLSPEIILEKAERSTTKVLTVCKTEKQEDTGKKPL